MTALLSVLCLGMLCVAYFVHKAKNQWVCWMALILVAVSLLVNALAPGNAVRAAMLEAEGIQRLSLIGAILSSFRQAIYYIFQWTGLEILLVLLLMLPFMLQISWRLNFSFRYPLVVFAVVFCLFAAQFSPPTLMNVSGSGRFMNIYYYFYIMSAFFCAFYGIGWLWKKLKKHSAQKQQVKNSLHFQRALVMMSILLLFFILVDFGFGNSAGKSAIRDLKNGKAQQFALERDARLSIYLNKDIAEAVVQPLTARPDLFSDVDIRYKEFWINQAVEKYYNKESVSLGK